MVKREKYRGYWICYNDLAQVWWVEKDGHKICYAQSREDARDAIEGLTN